MKKTIAVLLSLLFITGLFALEVDRKEVETDTVIEFINYTGPHTVIDTVEQIQEIGSSLGAVILKKGPAGDMGRYYVVHAVDSSVKTGFDADILILGAGATVDHIDNLRRIISAYLSSAYGYSEKDSLTLAKFVTVYNAVYRGKIDYFKTKYKPVVMKNLTADKAGLSVRYDEWAGRSQIVIPLSDARLAGTISSIDTTVLTGKEVVSKMQEEGTTATDTRKDMVDLKERESGAAQVRAETEKKDAVAAEKVVAEKKQALDTAVTEAAVAQKEADTAQKEAAAAPSDKAAQQKAFEAQKTVDEKKQIVENTKQEMSQAQETATQKQDAAKSDQSLSENKKIESQTERKQIAAQVQLMLDQKTEKAAIDDKSALASSAPCYGLRVIDSSSLLSELVRVNLTDGSILKTSKLNTIRWRTLFDTGSGLIAIAGKKGGNAAIKLVLISPETLEVSIQGTDTIAEQSMLAQYANDFYAVIDSGSGKYVLGRFDANLDAKAKSVVNVLPYTAITVTTNGILVQNAAGKIVLLRATDLVVATDKIELPKQTVPAGKK